jgi:hypothetical protein
MQIKRLDGGGHINVDGPHMTILDAAKLRDYHG